MSENHFEFWEGFNMAITIALNAIDHCEPGETFEDLRDAIVEEVDLYKRDG